jgi:hypothetical protein
MTVSIKLATPAELLGYVPYALGFHPSDSFVLIGIGAKTIRLSARADSSQPTRETVQVFRRVLSRAKEVTQVIVIGYGPPALTGPVQTIASRLEASGYLVMAALRVADGRYYCLQCDCTSPDGESFDPPGTASAASAVLAGLVALPSREEVVQRVRPVGGLAAVAMSQAVERAGARLSEVRSRPSLIRQGKLAIDEALALAKRGEKLGTDEVAWLSVLLADLSLRDYAAERTGQEEWQFDFWLDLLRRAEPMFVPPVATLFGWCAWRRGEGLLATEALVRALRIDPAYELARLLLTALDACLPPDSVTQ